MRKRNHSRQAARRHPRSSHITTLKSLYRRPLRYEPLEDRRLLAVVTVNTLSDVTNLSDNLTTLREAIFATNLVGGADTIDFAPALTASGPATILLTQGELKITDALSISGPGANLLTIDASGSDPTPDLNEGNGSRIFSVDDGNSPRFLNTSISGLTITGGDVPYEGGAILAYERLSLTNIDITSNSATTGGGVYYSGDTAIAIEGANFRGNTSRDGGGVFVASVAGVGGKATILSSSFSDNRASNSGGAVFLDGSTSFSGSATGGSATITDSAFTGNVASRQGGAVFLEGGSATASGFSGGPSATIIGSQFLSNRAGGEGGAVFAREGLPIGVSSNVGGSQISIANSKILGNSAGADGGGLFAGFSYPGLARVSISESEISRNTSAGDGGGVFAPGAVNIEMSVFEANAARRGGGISIAQSQFRSQLCSITDSVFSHNSALDLGGAVYAHYCRVLVTQSEVSANTALTGGGGMCADWIYLTVENSSIAGNAGGGILAINGTRTIIGSLIAGNSTGGSGGGILASGDATTIINSTLSGNSAAISGGGISQEFGTVSLVHSSIINNSATNEGGGVFAGTTQLSLYVDHTIIAGNHIQAGTAPDVAVTSEQLTTQYGLIGSNTGNNLIEAPVGSPDAYGNLIGGPVHGVIDPLLGPLADNGGFTLPDGSHILTHALLPGSPAINAGDLNKAGVDGVPEFDERGMPFGRVVNGRIDIGAFEYQAASDLNLLVDTLVDESDGDYSRGDLSLREAIELANLWPSTDTIHFDPALTASGPATILLTQGELKITDALTITGPGANFLMIDGQQRYRIFNIDNGDNTQIDVSISGVHLTRGNTTVYSTESLTLSDLLVDQNVGTNKLPAIYSRGILVMDDSRVTNNQGSQAITGGNVTLHRCDVSTNEGTGLYSSEGTAIYVADSIFASNGNSAIQIHGSNSVRLLGTTFADNYGAGNAGGLLVSINGTVLVSDCSFTRNTGTNTNLGGGGAYFIVGTGGNAQVERCAFTDNHAPTGAGLSVQGPIQIVGCDFTRNTTTGTSGSGGGLQLFSFNQGSQLVKGSTFRDNIAYLHGGAIYIGQSAGSTGRTVSLVGNTIIGNVADSSGGGIAIFANHDVVDIDATAIEANHAYLNGGGIFVQAAQNSQVRVANSTLNANSARQSGGGLLSSSTSSGVVIQQSTISGNTATATGGGLLMTMSGGSATVANTTITQNGFGTKSGGGLYTSGSGSLNINHTIIAGNVGNVQSSVDFTNRITNRTVAFSLIGNSLSSGLSPAPIGAPDANGNLIGGTTTATTINAKLGPLADNGGFTLPDGGHILTHALLPGSPAMNAGDPAAAMGVDGVPLHDQRGAPFIRVYRGRIDMGAVESQPTTLLGDYNANGIVDAADYVLWRKSTSSGLPLLADGNGDGQVNGADRIVWQANFGETATPAAVGASSNKTAAAPAFAEAPTRTLPARRAAFAATRPSRFRPSVADHLLATVAASRTSPIPRAAFAKVAMTTASRDEFAPAHRNLLSVVDEAFAAFAVPGV